MSDTYQNSGTLSRNERKEQPKHPDHKGKATITCPHCNKESAWWISAWIRTAQAKGNKFFSLAFQPKEQQKAAPQPKAATSDTPDDDVPF